jgi:coronin-1B/1C/6
VIPLNKPGRFATDIPIVSGHSAAVLDFDFNPFHDQILSSASEDQTVKIWGIPEGGLKANINDPLVDLHGHNKKVTLLKFHPTASNVLASASADLTVKLWDIEKGSEVCTLENTHDQLIQDIVWDYTGTTYTTSSKDKNVRIVDARTSTVVNTITTAHEGAKSTKLTYTGNLDRLITVGFTRQSQRQFKIWDPRKTDKELKKVDIDQAAGVIMPFFDDDTNVLYLAGKGDGNVRFYEIQGETPYCFPLSEQRSAVSAKGMAWVPKRGLNILGCETARLLKLTTNSVEPLQFFVPRKAECFQEDLYPNTSSNEPAHTSDQWLSGSNKPPRLMSLDPSAKPGSIPVKAEKKIAATVVVKTPAMLQRELDIANARIKSLEHQMRAAGLNPV